MASSSNTRRNIAFGAVLVVLTVMVATDRFGALFGDDNEVEIMEAIPEKPVEPPAPPRPPTRVEDDADDTAPPPLLGLSFQGYSERYVAVQDSFRARDQLRAEVDGKRVEWTGIVRNVSRQSNGFYVSVRPQERYSSVSALIVYPPEFEERVYALRPDDWVRFDGVVKRASGSLSIDGTAIEKTDPLPATD